MGISLLGRRRNHRSNIRGSNLPDFKFWVVLQQVHLQPKPIRAATKHLRFLHPVWLSDLHRRVPDPLFCAGGEGSGEQGDNLAVIGSADLSEFLSQRECEDADAGPLWMEFRVLGHRLRDSLDSRQGFEFPEGVDDQSLSASNTDLANWILHNR